MSSKTNSLDARMQLWLQTHACRPSAAMRSLCDATLNHAEGEMLTSSEQLQFIAFLAASIKTKNAIEIGVFTGASALAIAEVLPSDGTLVACDLTDEYLATAPDAWQEAGVEQNIDLRIAPALETLQALLDEGKANSFQFMYIDADKTNSMNYYEFGLQLLSTGGIIAIDNMFYGGQVADESYDDQNTVATRELAAFLHADKRIDFSLIPIGDGLALARVL
ncbi:MAG: class I SAM-dependent methyltransferase [Planctomycetes bacterium]|nr:class I SAM-dependent methyltransferase [Planctomycetota bacterium]